MAIQNIQTLFGAIRIEQVMTYMSLKKWRVIASEERLDFESEDAAGETQRLFLPAQQSHPKFRRLLPNLIFSLSVIEQREAIDVANEMVEQAVKSQADTIGPAAAAASTQPANAPTLMDAVSLAPKPQAELVLQNASNQPATIESSSGPPIRLAAGQAVVLQLSGPVASSVLHFTERLQIAAGEGTKVQFLWPKPDVPAATSAIDWIKQSLRTWSADVGSVSPAAEDLPAGLRVALERFQFSLLGLREPALDLRAWSLASAGLLADAIHTFSDSPRSRQHAFELARRLAALAGHALLVTPDAQDTLWHAGRSDSTAAPQATHRWLSACSPR